MLCYVIGSYHCRVLVFLLLIDHTSNNVICTVNNSSYVTDNVPAGFSSYTALQFLLVSLENLCLESFRKHRFLPGFTLVCCSKVFCVFTVSLRMEDDHRGGGGRVEGFVHQQQLFCSREGGRECWQFFECNVGWQSRVQGQHRRYDAVGQQAFWLYTKRKNITILNVSLPFITSLDCYFFKSSPDSRQLPLWE